MNIIARITANRETIELDAVAGNREEKGEWKREERRREEASGQRPRSEYKGSPFLRNYSPTGWQDVYERSKAAKTSEKEKMRIDRVKILSCIIVDSFSLANWRLLKDSMMDKGTSVRYAAAKSGLHPAEFADHTLTSGTLILVTSTHALFDGVPWHISRIMKKIREKEEEIRGSLSR